MTFIDRDPCSGYISTFTYLTLAIASWLFVDKASSLVLPWESSFRDGGRRRGFIQLVHADYRNLLRPLKFQFDDVVINHNYSIRGKYLEKLTCSLIVTVAL